MNSEIETARLHSLALEENRQVIQEKIAKKEKKKEKHKKRNRVNSTTSLHEDNHAGKMSDVEVTNGGASNGGAGNGIPAEMLPTERAMEDEANERAAEEERRRNREPPVVFQNIDVGLLTFYLFIICEIIYYIFFLG